MLNVPFAVNLCSPLGATWPLRYSTLSTIAFHAEDDKTAPLDARGIEFHAANATDTAITETAAPNQNDKPLENGFAIP